MNAGAAKRLYTAVSQGEHGAIATTNFVLDEAVTLVRMATDVDVAARLARGVLDSRQITVVSIDEDLFKAALAEFEKHLDKRWSLTDCSSFVVMRQLGVETAFSFDHHFEQAGFVRLP